MANGNGGFGWIQWAFQGIVTIGLAALAAFGGMKAGISEAQIQAARLEVAQVAMEQRLNRIEAKLDIVSDRLSERGRR